MLYRDFAQKDPSYFRRAAKWYAVAAEKGHAEAQRILGVFYAQGMGIEKNSAKAVDLFRKSAAQNNANGLYSLGYAYEIGEGMPPNREEAIAWYRKAVAQGQQMAAQRIKALGATP